MPSKKTKEKVLEETKERNERTPDRKVHILEDFEYHGTHQKVQVKCDYGHEWSTTLKYLIKGHWCPVCSRKEVGYKNTKSTDLLISKVEERNKKFPDKKVQIKDISEYIGMTKKMPWVCDQGHIWSALPKTIIKGSYCPECRRLTNIKRDSYSHQDLLDILEKRNDRNPHKRVHLHAGEVYTNVKDKLLFVCDNGHVWHTQVKNVIQSESGCPICSKGGFSYKSIEWLNTVSEVEGVNIQHIKNSPEEFKIPGTKYRVDGYCKETNTVYEFYGDFWHGNPETTNHDEINPSCKISFYELYQKTKQREKNIRHLGYKLITMWESEWDFTNRTKYEFQTSINKYCFNGEGEYNSNILGDDMPAVSIYIDSSRIAINICILDEFRHQKAGKYLNRKMLDRAKEKDTRLLIFFEDEWKQNQQLILDKIKYIAQRSNLPKIYARKCEVKQIPASLKASFLNRTHIQGDDINCKVSYGAFYENELVSVMTFVKPRIFMKGKETGDSDTYELSRFASINDYSVIGIASKLLKHFERDFSPKKIFSFADMRWSGGNLYTTLGFQLERTNKPDYFYIINGARKHRWQFRKDVLKKKLATYDPNLTEYENMLIAGHDRVWGCGTIKYVKVF